jgi:hypothetical protein
MAFENSIAEVENYFCFICSGILYLSIFLASTYTMIWHP